MVGKAAFYSAPARDGGGAHGVAVAFGTHHGGSATGRRHGPGAAYPDGGAHGCGPLAPGRVPCRGARVAASDLKSS